MSKLTPAQEFINVAAVSNAVAVISKVMRKYNPSKTGETVDTFYETQGNYIVSKLADAIITRSRPQ